MNLRKLSGKERSLLISKDEQAKQVNFLLQAESLLNQGGRADLVSIAIANGFVAIQARITDV